MSFIKKNLILSALISLLIIGGGVALVNQSVSTSQKNTDRQVLSANQKKTVATVAIDDDGKENKYDLNKGVGETALELTKDATSGKVVMTGSGVNAYVTAINGRSADDAKHEYWKLVINGKDSQVGAGSYTVKEGDSIVWKIDTY